MYTRFHRFVLQLASFVLLLAAAGCVQPLTPDDYLVDGVRMPIQIYVPTSGYPATKGTSPGDILGVGNESTFYDLHVWAFTHQAPGSTTGDTERPVAYMNVTDLHFSDWLDDDDNQKTYNAVMIIPRDVLKRPDDQLKMDFYVLANGQSIEFGKSEDPRMMTRGRLKEMVFGDPATAAKDWFGTSALGAGVPETGLPMTGFFNNRDNGYDISFLRENPDPSPEKMAQLQREWPTIQMKRAVSRMRFIFSRSVNVSNLTIQSIELTDLADGSGMIPSQTYLFPREVTPASGIELPAAVTYNSVTWGSATEPLLLNNQIGDMEDPTELLPEGNLAAQYYENVLQGHLTNGDATAKVLYLRESDKPIMGKIHYKVGNEEHTDTFTMVGLDNTNFFRNHSWTVIAYMVGQHLEIKVKVDFWNVPWEKKSQLLDEHYSLVVDQDGKFLVEAAMDKTGVGYNVPLPAAPNDTVRGRVVIYAPKNGRLVVTPVIYSGFNSTEDASDWFTVGTEPADPIIDPDHDNGIITVFVCRKKKTELPGGDKAIRLTFSVESGGRTIAADSEIIDDKYYFIIPSKFSN